MATNNSTNNKTSELTIDPGASGDSFIQFSFATQEFRIGVDDSASDSFKISQGSSLGTNDEYIITPLGEITAPETPCSLRNNTNTSLNNVTGSGIVYTVVFNEEVYDQNNNTTTTTFTAPVTGKYLICFSFALEPLSSDSFDEGYSQIDTSNRDFRSGFINYSLIPKGTGTAAGIQGTLSIIADLDTSDTVTAKIMIDGGASNTLDIYQFSTPRYTYISIQLIC